MRSVIEDAMPVCGKPRLEPLLEGETGVVRSNGDDRHTRTIPIVACCVKRPYISGTLSPSKDGGAGGGKRERFERGAVRAGGDEALEVHPALHRVDLVERRTGRGMARGEQRAAIRVRLDGDLECPDLLRCGRDLELVHADQRAQ